MTLIDTSSLVHLLRRKGDRTVKDRLNGILAGGDAATCDLVTVELWMGVGSRQDETDVTDLVSVLILLAIDAGVWERARKLAHACRKTGRPVPSSDVIIAACAFVHGASLDFEDKHFDLLETFR